MGERRLKIADVARDTGLNRGTITRLYNETASRVELNDIEVLCRYFEVDISTLFELTK
jgi:putative transcriptional regulator